MGTHLPSKLCWNSGPKPSHKSGILSLKAFKVPFKYLSSDKTKITCSRLSVPRVSGKGSWLQRSFSIELDSCITYWTESFAEFSAYSELGQTHCLPALCLFSYPCSNRTPPHTATDLPHAQGRIILYSLSWTSLKSPLSPQNPICSRGHKHLPWEEWKQSNYTVFPGISSHRN